MIYSRKNASSIIRIDFFKVDADHTNAVIASGINRELTHTPELM